MKSNGTASFDADIAIAGSGEGSLRAELTVSTRSITITASGAEIGSWPRSEVDIRRVGGGFVFGVEGEHLLVDVRDPNKLAIALHSGSRQAGQTSPRPAGRPATPNVTIEPPVTVETSIPPASRPEVVQSSPTVARLWSEPEPPHTESPPLPPRTAPIDDRGRHRPSGAHVREDTPPSWLELVFAAVRRVFTTHESTG